MKLNYVAKISGGQDGAIFGKYLFRFEKNGDARVYDLEAIKDNKGADASPISKFVLDKASVICPHSNSVAFGNKYFEEGDEFPLLYSNIYNNYANSEDPLKGVCCVYRIQREHGESEVFKSTLVQLIEIGFVNDEKLWRMSAEEESKRPYGNFVIDAERGIYYAFVMREACEGTRYFAFDVPEAHDGELDERLGVKRVVLNADDIKEYFDCEHHNFMQGACCHNSKVYSLEGFTNRAGIPAAFRIIDTLEKKQVYGVNLADMGYATEPELIDFYGDVCYYADVHGKLYTVDFE